MWLVVKPRGKRIIPLMLRAVPNSPALLVLALGLAACSQSPKTSGSMQGSNSDSGSQAAEDAAMTQADTGANQTTPDTGMMMTEPDTGVNNQPDTGQNMGGPMDAGFLMDAMAMNTMCPPTGAFGNQVGDITPNIGLKDCAGNSFSMHDICSRKASWMFVLPGW